jgi:competence protein ComGC
MSKERTMKILRLIKEGKGNFIEILIVTSIVSAIIMTMVKSQKPKTPQIEASELCLDYYLDENTSIISLYFLNKSQIAAHGPKIMILIPTITKEGTFTITETGDCGVVKMDDNLLVADFSQATIYPTFSNKREYSVVDFKFTGLTSKELKETEESIIYTINCDEGQFSGKIPVFYIFTFKKIH